MASHIKLCDSKRSGSNCESYFNITEFYLWSRLQLQSTESRPSLCNLLQHAQGLHVSALYCFRKFPVRIISKMTAKMVKNMKTKDPEAYIRYD